MEGTPVALSKCDHAASFELARVALFMDENLSRTEHVEAVTRSLDAAGVDTVVLRRRARRSSRRSLRLEQGVDLGAELGVGFDTEAVCELDSLPGAEGDIPAGSQDLEAVSG